MSQLEGKVALVTGAGSGIGRAIARRFAEKGAHVIAADISGAQVDTVAAIGGTALSVQLDVRDRQQVFDMVTAVVEKYGRIDIVSNNAATGTLLKAVQDVPAEAWDRVIEVNARGYLFVMQAAIPHMIAQGGGAIINMASLTAHRATAGTSAYVASKGAIVALTRSVALEYAANNIRANSISPGAIETPTVAGLPEDLKASLRGQIPMGRFGRPDEVAALVLFLASDEAPYISGQDIVIDGARSAG